MDSDATLTPVVLHFTPNDDGKSTSVRVRFYDGTRAVLEKSIDVPSVVKSGDDAIAAIAGTIPGAVWCESQRGIALTVDIRPILEEEARQATLAKEGVS